MSQRTIGHSARFQDISVIHSSYNTSGVNIDADFQTVNDCRPRIHKGTTVPVSSNLGDSVYQETIRPSTVLQAYQIVWTCVCIIKVSIHENDMLWIFDQSPLPFGWSNCGEVAWYVSNDAEHSRYCTSSEGNHIIWVFPKHGPVYIDYGGKSDVSWDVPYH